MTLAWDRNFSGPNRDYAVDLVYSVCCLAGDPEFIVHRRTGRKNSLATVIERRDSARLFDWWVEGLSYQGIADRIAHGYMQQHGKARWATISASLSHTPSCQKLGSYWQFEACGYRKGAETCGEPEHIAACPLPDLPLRNGHLNQMAYSLFLFIRDVAEGDLVAWIDAQLDATGDPADPDHLDNMRAALLKPLRCIYGVSDKVLSVTLADLLLGAGPKRPRWAEVGAR